PGVGDAGVVDQDVERAELGPGALDRCGDRGRVTHVELDGQRPTTGLGHLGDHLLEALPAPTAPGHRRTVLGQAVREAAPQPAAGAGHQRHLALEQLAHRGLLLPRLVGAWYVVDRPGRHREPSLHRPGLVSAVPGRTALVPL